MFSKEKGKTWKIVNIVLLLLVIICVIKFAIVLINGLLPAAGDYSKVDVNEFTYNILDSIVFVGVYSLALYLINQKINLFDKTYAFSRKLINLNGLFSVSHLLCKAFETGLCSSFQQCNKLDYWIIDDFTLSQLIAMIIVILLMLFFVNSQSILVVKNGKIHNFFNYISLVACTVTLNLIAVTTLQIHEYKYFIDYLRDIIICLIILGIFIVVLYVINYRQKDVKKSMPKAFKTE